MTDRIPLIVNRGTAQIQELPSGDSLDLTNSGISNANTINATTIVANSSTISGNVTAGNVLADGYFFANGTQFTSGGGGGGASGGTSITMSLIFGR